MYNTPPSAVAHSFVLHHYSLPVHVRDCSCMHCIKHMYSMCTSTAHLYVHVYTCTCTCMYSTNFCKKQISVHISLHYGFQACFPKAVTFTMEPCGVTNMVKLYIQHTPISHSPRPSGVVSCHRCYAARSSSSNGNSGGGERDKRGRGVTRHNP